MGNLCDVETIQYLDCSGSSLTLPWISDAATTPRIDREEVGYNWELAWLL